MLFAVYSLVLLTFAGYRAVNVQLLHTGVVQ